jgi:hypothetical protein
VEVVEYGGFEASYKQARARCDVRFGGKEVRSDNSGIWIVCGVYCVESILAQSMGLRYAVIDSSYSALSIAKIAAVFGWLV